MDLGTGLILTIATGGRDQLIGRRGHARTVRACSALLRDAGFTAWTWHRMPLLRTVVATAG